MSELPALRLGDHDLSSPACHAMLASVATTPGVRASIDADHTGMTDDTVAVLAAAAAGSLAQTTGIGQYMGLYMDTRQLHVAGNQITGMGAGTLAELLLRSAHLQVLDVSGNPVGNDGMNALLQAAAASLTLSSLDAEAVGMTFAGLADLASPLLDTDAGHRPALSRLNLARNYLGNDGAAFIAESWHAVPAAGPAPAPATPLGLPATACLRSLDLRHCGIGPEGACIMAAALAGGCIPLQALRLAGNPIQDDGVRALCAACTPPLGSLDATYHTHASGSAHARLRFTCNVRVLDFADVQATDDALPSLLTLVLSRARVSLLYWLLTELDKPAMAKWCAALAAAQDPAPAPPGKRAGSASQRRPSGASSQSKAKGTQLPTIWRDMLAAASQARQARMNRRAGTASSVDDDAAPELLGQPSHGGTLACLATPPLQLHLQQNTLSVDACLVLAAGSFCWGLHAAAGPVPHAVAGRERARAKPGLALDTFRQVAAADACRPGAGPGPAVHAVLVAPGLSPGPARTAMPTEAVLARDRDQPYAASVAAQAVLLRSWPVSACAAGFSEAVQDPAPAVQVKLAGNVHADANFSVWLQRGRAVCALGLQEHQGNAQLLRPGSITPSSGPLELAYAGACAAMAQDELAWLMKAVSAAATYSARGKCSVWRGVQRGLAEEGMAHLDASMRAQGTGFWRGDVALAATTAAAEWLGSHALAAAMPWGGAELLRQRPMSSLASQLPSAPVPHSMLWSLMDRHTCNVIARAAAAHSGNESWVKQFTVVPALLESSDHSAPSWNAALCAALPGRVHGARAALQKAGLQAGMLLRVAPTIQRHVEFRVQAMAQAAARGTSPPPRMQAGRAVPAGAMPRLQQVAHDTLAHTLALDTGAAPLDQPAAAADSQLSTPALLSYAESLATSRRSRSDSPDAHSEHAPLSAAPLAHDGLQTAPVPTPTPAPHQAAPPAIRSTTSSIQATPIRSPPMQQVQPAQQLPVRRAAPASSIGTDWQPVGLSAQLANSSPASRVNLIQSWIQSPALSIPMPEVGSAPPTAQNTELLQRSTGEHDGPHQAHPMPVSQAYASLSSRAVWAQLAHEDVPLARPDLRTRPAASQPPPPAPRAHSRPASPLKQVSMQTCSVAHIVPRPPSNNNTSTLGSANSTLATALGNTSTSQPDSKLAVSQGAAAHLRPQASSRRASTPSQSLSIAVDAAACRLAPPATRARSPSSPAERSPSSSSRARRKSPAKPRSVSPPERQRPSVPPPPASSATAQVHAQRASPRSSPGLTVKVITRAAAQPAWSGLPAAPMWQPIRPAPGTASSPGAKSAQFPELQRLRERLIQLSSMSTLATAQQERATSTPVPAGRVQPERPLTAMSDWLQSPSSAPGSRRHADPPADFSPADSHQSIADVAMRLFQWEAATEDQHAAQSSSSASSSSFLVSPEPVSLPSQGSPGGMKETFTSTLRTPLSSELLASARLSSGSSSSEYSAGSEHAASWSHAGPTRASSGAVADSAQASIARANALLARMPDLADMADTASHLHDISSSASSDSAGESIAPAVKSLPISPEAATSAPAPGPARSIPPPHVAVPSARTIQLAQSADTSSESRPRVSRGRGLKLPGSPEGGTRSNGVSFSSTVEVRTFPRT